MAENKGKLVVLHGAKRGNLDGGSLLRPYDLPEEGHSLRLRLY